MPPELENAAEIDKIDPALDAADASQEAEKSATAESSTATDASKPEGETALSVVRDVVGKRDTTSAASSAENVEQGQKPGTATPKELDNENFSDVPFNKHPRFRELVTQLKETRVDAQRYRNVTEYIEGQGLSADEAAGLLQIGGLIKTNPAEAWKRMQPVVQQVLQAAGELLPDDLKQLVADGKMPVEAAQEVSRSRAAVKAVEVRQQFDQHRQTTRQQTEALTANRGAVSSWEADRRTRDPNFDAKMPAIQKEVVWLQSQEGRPNTPEGVKAQLQKAYDAASAAYVPPAPVRQQRPALRPVTGGQVTGNVRPEINTTIDAIRTVVGRRAG